MADAKRLDKIDRLYLPPLGEGWDDQMVERRLRDSIRMSLAKELQRWHRKRKLVAFILSYRRKPSFTLRKIGELLGCSATQAMTLRHQGYDLWRLRWAKPAEKRAAKQWVKYHISGGI